MKSKFENQYEQFVIHRICTSAIYPTEAVSLLIDFHNHSKDYYESLCDIVYLLATGRASGRDLWLQLNGVPYLAHEKRCADDIRLLTSLECPEFLGDLIEPLELIHTYMQTAIIY